MLLFDIALAEEDLAVLSAYARAQDLADAQKAAHPQEAPAACPSLEAVGEAADSSLDESSEDDEDMSVSGSKPATRRTYTWISRLRKVEGVLPDQMAPIHGRLIAQGLLQFQLQGREEGVVYRVTSAGRQMLNTPAAEAA